MIPYWGNSLKIIKGIIASPGLATGEVYVYEKIDYLTRIKHDCYTLDPRHDIDILKRAYEKVIKDLDQLSKSLSKKEVDLIEAQKLMLEALVNEAKELISSERLCSAQAVKKIYEKYDDLLSKSGSELINLRRADLRALALRVISYIMGKKTKGLETKTNAIIVSEEISPFDFMELRRNNINGIVTIRGGPTSHVAILARTYGVPYLIINDPFILGFNNKKCVLDCLNGYMIIDPNEEYIRKYSTMQRKYAKLMKEFKKYSKEPAKTKDGVNVKVECNIGMIEDLRLIDEYGCDGIGLFRIEFMYINREYPPSEDDLIESFTKITNIVRNKEIVIRAPDLGADKPVKYLDFGNENNPQLGMRGIRLLLKYKEEILYPFIKSLILTNKNGNVKLLLPMITSIDEIMEVVKLIEQVVQEIGNSAKNIHIPDLGIMIETPSSIYMLDQIIEKTPIKFISIGTNDLTQYILAIDRTNPRLSHMYNELHPAVIRALRQVMDIVHSAPRNIDVKVCGEVAGQTRAIPILLSLGIRELSVAPTFVGKVKYYISKIDLEKIKRSILNKILKSSSAEEIESYIRNIYREINLEYIP